MSGNQIPKTPSMPRSYVSNSHACYWPGLICDSLAPYSERRAGNPMDPDRETVCTCELVTPVHWVMLLSETEIGDGDLTTKATRTRTSFDDL